MHFTSRLVPRIRRPRRADWRSAFPARAEPAGAGPRCM